MTERFILGEQDPTDKEPDVDESFATGVGLNGLMSFAEGRRSIPEPMEAPSSLDSRRHQKLKDDNGINGSMYRHPAGSRRAKKPSEHSD